MSAPRREQRREPRRGTRSGRMAPLDFGGVEFAHPLLLASGTAGHGTELAEHIDLARVGGIVVKSLHHQPWPGNPAPRLRPTAAGMLNAVGLQGPGVRAWVDHELPALRATGATVVASIWGRSIEDYRKAAEMLSGVDGIVAIEINLSCPNLEGRSSIFAHDPILTAEVVRECGVAGLPMWAKLSANTDRVLEVAEAAHRAGAAAVTVINTMLGLHVDPVNDHVTPAGGNGQRGGGLSGPAIHPVALRTVWDLHRAHPAIPIVGAGGVASGRDAMAMLHAGASLVQVGTATFRSPRSSIRIANEMSRLARSHGAHSWRECVGRGHRVDAS